jgi:hypothetical protein
VDSAARLGAACGRAISSHDGNHSAHNLRHRRVCARGFPAPSHRGAIAETLQAALRYLLFAIFGSAPYLAGTALLDGA